MGSGPRAPSQGVRRGHVHLAGARPPVRLRGLVDSVVGSAHHTLQPGIDRGQLQEFVATAAARGSGEDVAAQGRPRGGEAGGRARPHTAGGKGLARRSGASHQCGVYAEAAVSRRPRGRRGDMGAACGTTSAMQLGRRPPRPSLVSAATLARPVPPGNATWMDSQIHHQSEKGATRRSRTLREGRRPRAGRWRGDIALHHFDARGEEAPGPLGRSAQNANHKALGDAGAP
jgi:hypothetical protein